jgi:hypothetical protein
MPLRVAAAVADHDDVLEPCERRLFAMSVSTAWKVACDSTTVPGDMFGRSGLPVRA